MDNQYSIRNSTLFTAIHAGIRNTDTKQHLSREIKSEILMQRIVLQGEQQR